MADDVIMIGPIFDGRAEEALHEYVRKMPQEIAQRGADMVRDKLNETIYVNKGVYVSRINVRDSAGGQLINDRGSVYGPWLEGTSIRNHSTRFKGHWAFRRATQELDDKAEEMAEEILQRYLEEMR